MSFIFLLPSTPLAAGDLTYNEIPSLQFPVISDVHICGPIQTIGDKTICQDDQWHSNHDVRFQQALNDLKTIAPNYAAIAIVGDSVDHGLSSQYDLFMQMLNAGVNPNAEKIITMGNHEFFEKHYWKPELTDGSLVDRFVQKTGMPGVYYDKWVQGYHFIALGGETTRPDDFDSAYISDAQYEWLEKTLPVNSDPTKPIFVFLHQPIKDTVYGSDVYYGLSDGRLFNILKKYPQVILFSGHSHYLLNHPRSVYQDGFTMVNTSSVNYDFSDNGVNWDYSQGFLVNVYKDHVDLKAREFTTGSWIRTFTIKLPFEKTIDDTEKPFFPTTASAKVKSVSDTAVTISWDAAQDNEVVDKYYIKVNGTIVKTVYPDYWDPGVTSQSTILSNLLPGSKYNFEVVAGDGWNNTSDSTLKLNTTTTSHLRGWNLINHTWYFFDRNTGLKRTGWFYDKNWFYLNETGAMQTSWKEVSNKWYYFSSNGSMQSGWLLYKGSWYYLTDNGMATGWRYVSGNWYYLNDNGTMKTGWLLQHSNWYYLTPGGNMVTGYYQVGGKTHFFNKYGVYQY